MKDSSKVLKTYHDQERIASIANRQMYELISFYSYIRGQLFIYAGQEYGIEHRPDLFEKDPINWIKNDTYLDMYKKAIEEKKKQKDNYKIKQRFAKLNSTTIEVAKYLNRQVIDKNQFKLL